ncbi:MAG: ABC transporter ATP-binding protein [Campylobacterota bacterium]|nr:ABC transporter ATP-binding protein [Campylobacterota bacterium]
MIEIRGIVKNYKAKGKVTKALKGLSLNIKQGEIFGFLGPNGAGKTTTIKIMVDLIRADKGEVLINGISSLKPKSRESIGFLPEHPAYFDFLTGRELLRFAGKMHNTGDSKREEKLLKTFELLDVADKQVRKYSKGMIQRLGFAMAIIHNPDILILDEPMSGLDPMGRFILKKIIKDLKDEGKTVFFSSHIIPDVEELCDRVGIINKGELVSLMNRKEIQALTVRGFKITHKDKGDIQNKIVDKDKLVDELETLKQNNMEILNIEPIKKGLEEIFVEIVSK